MALPHPKLPKLQTNPCQAFRLSLMFLVIGVDSLVSASQDPAAQVTNGEIEREVDRGKELSEEQVEAEHAEDENTSSGCLLRQCVLE